ncbi:T9SS type A sorting domain-containing protein [Fluviicola sp.]|uniref:T9SS type A sorting domain-containing protein n=1 Tax=Fluviicola sp. TaxID=1917219 RepID=UPI00261D16FD|nr:T9SS type A sorting domain-containing protein [Fluviicola sp.]
MKQSLLLIGGMFASAVTLFAQQTPVSQTAQNKNAVLEELTGVNCQWCPAGHKLANDISTANPGRVVLVNVHAGSFAAPGAGQPDLRTADGTALDGFFDPAGYPAGAVQRTAFGSETFLATGRGNWQGQINTALGQPSPVNVAMDATIDASTRQLTLHVEIFYTTPQPAGTNHYLNVGILQNDYEGPQISATPTLNPAAMLPNGKYLHQHIFRGYINAGGTWGEQIDASQTGVITKTITYTLPANVGTVPLNIGKLQFFAILHEGHNTYTNSKAITAAEVVPTLTNVPAPTASANSIVNTFNVCDGQSITPIIKVDNSGDAITSINFSTVVNGGTAVPFTFNGNIPAFGSQEITLPAMVVNAQGTNTVQVTITSVNGGSGSVGTVSVATKPIAIASVAMGLNAIVKMTTDRYGDETTWKLFNSSNTVVAQGGPYAQAAASGAYPQPDVNVTLVANECYKAVVYDAYGDGFDSGYGNGDFKITVNGTTVASIATYASGASMDDAMKVDATASISEATAEIGMSVYPNPASGIVNVSFEGKGGDYTVSILDISGRTVATQVVSNVSGSTSVEMPITSLQAGNYFVSVAQGGSSYTQKLMVK